MKRFGAVASAALVVVLAACGGSGSKVKKQADTINSWAATAQLLQAGWHRGELPRPYVRSTLQDARKELKCRRAEVGQYSPPQLQRTALQICTHLAQQLRLAEKTK